MHYNSQQEAESDNPHRYKILILENVEMNSRLHWDELTMKNTNKIALKLKALSIARDNGQQNILVVQKECFFVFSIQFKDMKDYFAVIVLLLLLNQSLCLSFNDHEDALADFCWKDSYGRGVGTIPTTCGTLDKIGLLCYPKCPAGYSRFGFDCHQNCPTTGGWTDQGLFCRQAEYGRGAGYPWKFGDALNSNGMFSRCEADNGKGNCEQNAAMVYPKCKPGYTAYGCCICRPAVPNCAALGFNGGIDLSCAKRIIVGAPTTMSCAAGLQYDAGLCYTACKAGFYGAGPVCWANNPTNWVGCGMGAATSAKVCSDTIFDQVTSVGNMALNIATFGAGKAASIAKDSAKAAELKKQFQALKKLTQNNDKVQKLIANGQGKFPATEAGKSAADILKADPATVTPEDIVRVSAQIASLVDPSGASDVVAAYAYSKCSALKI